MKWRGWMVAGMLVIGGAGWGYTHMWRTAPAPGTDVEPVADDRVFPDSFFDFSPVLQMAKNVPQSASAAATEPSYTAASARTPSSEAAIRAKYEPAFDELKREADERLDYMVSKGLEEYRKSRATGSPTMQELMEKYAEPAKRLEASINDTFYRLLAQMEGDLQRAGLPLDLALRMESEYRASLQQKKAELMARILNR